MNFDNKFPEWKNEGAEPSADLKESGFTAGYKPPASIFNWFWSKVSKAITEIQNKLSKSKIAPIVTATSTDGATYTATVDGITELSNGLEIVIIPNMTSTNTAVKFDLNGLGAKNVRLKINGYNNGNSGTTAAMAGWIGENVPLAIRYISKFDNWQTVDFSRPSASGLYGAIKPHQGGTGISNAEGIAAGNFLVGNGAETMLEKTPAEVLEILTGKSKLSDITVGGADWAEWANHLGTHNCSNTDFNTLKTSGFYYGYTGMTNAAFTSEISVMEVIPYSNDWVLQRQARLTDGVMKYRFYSGVSGWSDWYLVYTSNNPPSDMATVTTGTYVGNRSETKRTIHVGGKGGIVVVVPVRSGSKMDYISFITPHGSVAINSSSHVFYDTVYLEPNNMDIIMSTLVEGFNGQNVTYQYYLV